MTNVIVVFSKLEDAKSIRNILMKSGFHVVAVCTSGSQVLSCAGDLSGGIVVSGYRLPDMVYSEIREFLPAGFDMLVVASPGHLPGRPPDNLVCLPTPLKVHEFISTLEMMSENYRRRKRKQRQQPKHRSEEEKNLINRAKGILMERNHMTEDDAYRYIQKCSMDNGTNMVETAEMIISLMGI